MILWSPLVNKQNDFFELLYRVEIIAKLKRKKKIKKNNPTI